MEAQSEENKNSIRGKKSRAKGQRFEARVRGDLEKKEWIVDRWTNTVDYDKNEGIGKIVSVKPKFVFNPKLKRRIMISNNSGFPDFIIFKKEENKFDIIGVEVKGNGYLDQIEKGMCIWLLENKIFSKILIARRGKKRGEIEYLDFREKYNKT